MRQDFWQFKPSHTLVLATNHKPVVQGTDLGIWRRIRLVPFTVTIPEDEQDHELTRKLQAEYPAILRWAVDGCLAWQRDGLKAPKEVTVATAKYRSSQDVLGVFLEECCLTGPQFRVKAGNLYDAYKNWCESSGEDAVTLRRFGEHITERDIRKEKQPGRGTWYIGIGLREGREG